MEILTWFHCSICIVLYSDHLNIINNNNNLSLAALTEIRAQLVEQLKCLDQQCELRVQLLQDLQDFFRKKAEIEMDYSRNMEKLAERFLTKTRSTKDHLLKYENRHTLGYQNGVILCSISF